MVILAVVLSIASFAGMLRLKTDVETLAGKRRVLVNERTQLREEKRVLEAELAYLAKPQTLMDFAKKRGYVGVTTLMVEPMQPAEGGDAVVR